MSRRGIFLLALFASIAAPALAEKKFPPLTASQDSFVVRANNTNSLVSALRLLPPLRTKIEDALGVELTDRFTIAVFDDDAAWKSFLANGGFQPDGRGLLDGKLIAVEMKSSDAAPEFLAHELVHAALREKFQPPLPLWFDEGVASYLGWRVARDAVYELDHRKLDRTLPTMPDGDILPLGDMLMPKAYPDGSVKIRAFYRESEELVRLLDERLGDDGIRKIAARLSDGMSLRDCLKKDFGYGDAEWQQLGESLRSRCMLKQEW